MTQEQRYETEFIFKYLLNFKNVFIDFILIVIINTMIALAVAAIRRDNSFPVSFIISQAFGVTVSAAVFFSLLIFRPRTWKSLFSIAAIDISLGVCGGLLIGIFILKHFLHIFMDWRMHSLWLTFITSGIIFSSFIFYLLVTKIRLQYRSEMIAREKIKHAAMEKEYLSANLKMLQAQMEPHFLFNTLSNVLSLIDTQPEKGKSMLLDLTKLLRTTLSRTMPDRTTLAQEISMIEAYLNIQKIRMDSRLHYTIDVPDNIRQYSFPPMLLQPLVENALRHGLEPKEEGGEIIISAEAKDHLLIIKVADTGLGFSDFDKAGVGIANVRERLALLYGDAGRLLLEENKPHGVCAIMEVPLSDL
ncbi:MAG TPA: histidine kinase [Smithella sp.]|nr:histidine kinase [Smithella sp.]